MLPTSQRAPFAAFVTGILLTTSACGSSDKDVGVVEQTPHEGAPAPSVQGVQPGPNEGTPTSPETTGVTGAEGASDAMPSEAASLVPIRINYLIAEG
jgi:hypothetical protein